MGRKSGIRSREQMDATPQANANEPSSDIGDNCKGNGVAMCHMRKRLLVKSFITHALVSKFVSFSFIAYPFRSSIIPDSDSNFPPVYHFIYCKNPM